MKRVTQEDIININELYCKIGVKAQVARELGFSPSTVSKYIIPNYKPIVENEIKRYKEDLPKFDPTIFRIKDWTPLLQLSDAEFEEIKELWGELRL